MHEKDLTVSKKHFAHWLKQWDQEVYGKSIATCFMQAIKSSATIIYGESMGTTS